MYTNRKTFHIPAKGRNIIGGYNAVKSRTYTLNDREKKKKDGYTMYSNSSNNETHTRKKKQYSTIKTHTITRLQSMELKKKYIK